MSDMPGKPDALVLDLTCINPPIATILPSWMRTMVSNSLTELDANGSRKLPTEPRSTCLSFSVTDVTDGRTCRVILLALSTCGVTSSEMPEKKGVRESEGRELLVVPSSLVVEPPPATLVTKNSSVPTLSKAFWLFKVAIRGLLRVCTSPRVCRNPSTA